MPDPLDPTTLRAHWQAPEEAFILALLGDWPAAADALGGIVAVGLAAETGRPLRMLAHPRARGIDRAIAIAAAMGRADRVITDERALPPWPILPAVDAALAIGPHCARSVEAAKAAGVAVVRGEGDVPRELSRALVAAHDAAANDA